MCRLVGLLREAQTFERYFRPHMQRCKSSVLRMSIFRYSQGAPASRPVAVGCNALKSCDQAREYLSVTLTAIIIMVLYSNKKSHATLPRIHHLSSMHHMVMILGPDTYARSYINLLWGQKQCDLNQHGTCHGSPSDLSLNLSSEFVFDLPPPILLLQVVHSIATSCVQHELGSYN